MKIEDPFHAGEIEAQHLAGEAAIAEGNSVVIADSIIAGALPFLKQQKMVVIGTKAEDGSIWASPLFGLPGFVSPADDRTVHFHRAQIRMSNADIFWRNLYSGARAGMCSGCASLNTLRSGVSGNPLIGARSGRSGLSEISG